MTETSTILLEKKVIESLKRAKEHPRQTYNEIIEKMAQAFIKSRRKSHYDEFIHTIQQQKMQELWDNEEDESWESA